MVSAIYREFKDFCETELADDENPRLGPVAFNDMVPPSLTTIIIHLVGVQKVDTRRMDKKLSRFRDGNARLCSEEGVNGKPEWWVEIPLPRKKKKHGSKRSVGRHKTPNPFKPSCTKLLLCILLFVLILFGGLVTDNLPFLQ